MNTAGAAGAGHGRAGTLRVVVARLEAITGQAVSPDPSAARFFNRELSWLDFNARVLAMAADPDVPLLERCRFLAIFSQNLDEFFQVRVAGLKDQVAGGLTRPTPDGRSPAVQLLEIREKVERLTAVADEIFLEDLTPALAGRGVRFSSWPELDDEDRKHLVGVFEERIFPVLTPLAVDPAHPFPYISDLSLNLGVTVVDPATGDRRFARVKVPPLIPRFVVMPDGERFVPLEQVIAEHLGALFPGMEIASHHPFRVTRNADFSVDDEEAEDLLAAVELELRRRRFGKAVRLEIDARMDAPMRDLLARELDLEPDDIYEHRAPLDLGGLWSLLSLDRPDLRWPPLTPVTPARLAPEDHQPPDVFATLRHDGNLLVQHPYDSFATTVQEFIRQAADDPAVLAIKLTLYRTSGDSPIVRSLIRAAESGKQVAVLVELKARFDERANIEWAKVLEQAGVHVTYGLVGLKTHAKTALVVRDEPDGIRRYCHVGTGNYNPTTARVYEDLGLLSADQTLGADLTLLFNALTGFARDVRYRKLIVAPHHLRRWILDRIEGEARRGPEGRIVAKMNALTDPEVIEALYAASAAGTPVSLIVRGICCLRPGVEGLSETIRVRSIVGRFLEHSRIYHFAHGDDGGPAWYIGSADLMERNLDRRVEALVPVLRPDLRARLRRIVEVCLADDVRAWELRPDGSWFKVPTVDGTEAHVVLAEEAVAAGGAPPGG